MAAISSRRRLKQRNIQVGTLILRERLLLPKAFELPTETYWEGWTVLNIGDVFTLDCELRSAGWNFFSVAGNLEASAIGSTNPHSTTREKVVHRAVHRILTTAQAHSFNCLEVTSILRRHFLGIPYMTVMAQSRHIQESRLLQNMIERLDAQKMADALGSARKPTYLHPHVTDRHLLDA